MTGTRAIGVVIAESLASVETTVTMPQLRVLILASAGPLNVSAVAQDLGVHPSNATRTCDRLVRAGLIERNPDPDDRRHVRLTATEAGTRLLNKVMEERRTRVVTILEQMTEEDRTALADSLAAFTAAVAHEHDGLEAVAVQP